MRQYELTIRIAQIHHLIEVRKYKKALAVVKTLDMRQVKGISDLNAIADVYTKTEQFDAAKNTYLRIYKKSRTRRVLYRLIYLAIRTNALDEAEGYYQEFVAMNSSRRDALILRYRIDKASGASIEQLIEILESLKEEEYIEEWAYELAKLYFKAGHFDECRSECEDIKLWFGRGEIVDRAKRLITSIDNDEQLAYVDDRDYTVEKEIPNPDDTGSLPDLTEYVESESELERHDNSIGSKVKKAIKLNFEEDEESLDDSFNVFNDEEESEYARDEAVDQLLKMDGQEDKNIEESKEDKDSSNAANDSESEGDEEFLDDSSPTDADTILYENDDEVEDFDGVEMARRAIDGLQKLSGLWKHSSKFSNNTETVISENKEDDILAKTKHADIKYEDDENIQDESSDVKKKEKYSHHSQSGTGITQDLSKEISAIYEAEKREQLKVHSIKVKEKIKSDMYGVEQAGKPDDNYVISREEAMAPSDIEEIKSNLKGITGNIFNGKKNRIVDTVADDWGHTEPIDRVIEEVNDSEKEETTAIKNQEVDEHSDIMTKNDDCKINKEDSGDSVDDNNATEVTSVLQNELTDKTIPDEKSETEIKLERAAKLFGINKNKAQSDVENDITDYSTPEDDLPTTRALHKTFSDVLTLINAEKDPSHFVLIGEDSKKIVTASKKIVKVLKKNGFLSQGRIGCIEAKQLNQMNFDVCKEQLKGSCLLVNGAADLYFPTITKIFGLMDEFYGDFIVILADEGDTLDQMFRFAPALAKKFKYVIDINRYTEEELN